MLSKIKEYVKLLPEALKNPEDIIKGWINDLQFELGTLSEEYEAEIIRRRAICATCPHNSKFHVTAREDEHCICCGCPIAKKTACFECNCGLENKFPNNPEEYKWLRYEKKSTNENQD